MIIVKKPKIRFKGFTETWEQRKLGDLCKIITKGTTPKDKTNRGDVNFIKVENINPENGEISNTTKITLKEHEEYLKRSRLFENDILFSIAGTLGRVAIIKSSIIPANTNQALAIIRLSEGDISFIATMLKGRAIEDYIRKNPTVGAQPNLSLEQISNFIVPFTLATEQKKIGSLFSKLDHLITLHQRQCENLKKLKKFMLQKLFPQNGESVPKIRFLGFTDTWEQRKLGEVFNERTKRAKGNEELLSVTINNGVIRQIDSDKRNIASEDKSNYKIVQIGDVPYNSMRMWQGAVGNSEYNGIVSPAYTVLVPSTNADSKFFVELFKKNSTLNIFQRWSQGLTSDTWNLKYPILSKIEFYMPMIDEQKKIGSLFSKLDYLITLHQSKCDNLKEVKKYMLQNMFI